MNVLNMQDQVAEDEIQKAHRRYMASRNVKIEIKDVADYREVLRKIAERRTLQILEALNKGEKQVIKYPKEPGDSVDSDGSTWRTRKPLL